MAGIWEDREFVSRFATETVRLQIVGSVPTSDVLVDMVNVASGVAVFDNRISTPEPDGVYALTLGTADTAEPGYYDLVWTWQTDTADQEARTFIWVGQASPFFDALDQEMQALVVRVWWRFADLFDSPMGGPYLQTQFQTRFTPNRLAQIMSFALGRLNSIAQPHQTYTLTEPNPFPHEQWGALLEYATYVETIKHLKRSYVEQPDWQGVTVARADRRDYLQRWDEILDMEQADLKAMLDVFKIAHMGLGRPHVLVSGGVYGNYGPNSRASGHWATRPRFYARFYV